MSDKLLLDITEVAELLGISRPSVYELMHRQYYPLPYIRLGRRVKISRVELEKWIAECPRGDMTYALY